MVGSNMKLSFVAGLLVDVLAVDNFHAVRSGGLRQNDALGANLKNEVIEVRETISDHISEVKTLLLLAPKGEFIVVTEVDIKLGAGGSLVPPLSSCVKQAGGIFNAEERLVCSATESTPGLTTTMILSDPSSAFVSIDSIFDRDGLSIYWVYSLHPQCEVDTTSVPFTCIGPVEDQQFGTPQERGYLNITFDEPQAVAGMELWTYPSGTGPAVFVPEFGPNRLENALIIGCHDAHCTSKAYTRTITDADYQGSLPVTIQFQNQEDGSEEPGGSGGSDGSEEPGGSGGSGGNDVSDGSTETAGNDGNDVSDGSTETAGNDGSDDSEDSGFLQRITKFTSPR